MKQHTSPWQVLPVLPNTTAYLPWRSMLLLNSVSQSVHGITKLVLQARMLRVLTLLSIKNTSKGPRALILSGSEMSFKAPIIYLFNLVYLWLHRLLSKWLSFLFCLYPFYQPPIPSNLPSIFLKYISDHAACSLKKKNKNKKQRTNPSFSVWRVSLLACVSDLAPHPLLQPLLCVYPTLRPQRTPYHFQILKGSVPCSLLLCMKCPPQPTQWGTAQTFPLLWNYRHSSLLYLSLFQPKQMTPSSIST